MRPIIPLALVTVLAAGCASVPPDQDPVQIRLNDLDARVSKVERVVSNQSLVQLATQVDTLQAEVRDLRGQVEDLQNTNRQLRSSSGISTAISTSGSRGCSREVRRAEAPPRPGRMTLRPGCPPRSNRSTARLSMR